MVITFSLILTGLILPLLMVVLGRWLFRNAPKDINALVGYRTKRSMRSKEAWDYANVTSGKYWFVLGLVCLPVFLAISSIVSVIIEHDNVAHTSYSLFSIVALELIPLFSVIPYTEKKLKDKFG